MRGRERLFDLRVRIKWHGALICSTELEFFQMFLTSSYILPVLRAESTAGLRTNTIIHRDEQTNTGATKDIIQTKRNRTFAPPFPTVTPVAMQNQIFARTRSHFRMVNGGIKIGTRPKNSGAVVALDPTRPNPMFADAASDG